MESGGLAALGLDLRALIFQVVNFAILLVLLKQFALRPILKILEERRLKIAESLASAQAIEQARARLEQEQQALRQTARQQADEIINQSKRRGREIVQAAQAEGQQKAEALVTAAQGQIAQEVATVKQQLKTETLNVVAAATEKIIQAKIDPKKDAALIRNLVAS